MEEKAATHSDVLDVHVSGRPRRVDDPGLVAQVIQLGLTLLG